MYVYVVCVHIHVYILMHEEARDSLKCYASYAICLT